jgi:hypothetical protein
MPVRLPALLIPALRWPWCFGLLCLAVSALAATPPNRAQDVAEKSLALDGSAVLTAGNFHVNVTNWGLIGSRYSYPSSYFGAPSGQWPGGSGEEYLFSAGLWIGGRQFGVTGVSSGQPASELRPPFLPEYVMYEARDRRVVLPERSDAVTGTPGDLDGGDDDGDGWVDEDRLDGFDNDGDGRIDEDFAQRGTQMFACTMRDDDPVASQMFPDHHPLHLEIYQEACAWNTPDAQDIVGLRWTIKNAGPQPILDIHVGLFVDGDLGRHDDPDGGKDDIAGTFDGLVRQREGYFEDFSYGWMRDIDANDALEGWLAACLDGSGFGDSRAVRPEQFRTTAIRVLNADHAAGFNGIPFLDSERYNLLSEPGRDRDVDEAYPGDYAILLSVGPYTRLEPGEYIVVEAVLTVAAGRDALHDALRRGRDLADGRWYDADFNYRSGRRGAESLVCAEDFGLPWDAPDNPLYRRFASYWNEDCMAPGTMVWPIAPGDLQVDWQTQQHCMWVSMDNCEECERYYGRPCTRENPGVANCYGNTARSRGACTGVSARETRVPWVERTLLPPLPSIRLVPRDRGMDIFWDDRSEREVDPLTGQDDFESYRVWRADDWHRPVGTSEDTGPPVIDWGLVAEYDRVNFFPGDPDDFPRSFGFNTGLDVVAYRPVCLDDPRFDGLAEAMDAVVQADVTGELQEAPPLRDGSGLPLPQYEGLLPWEPYPDVLDTFFAVAERTAEGTEPKEPVRYYVYHDEPLHNGFVYFYAVTATDHVQAANGSGVIEAGGGGLPSGSFAAGVPRMTATDPDDPRTAGLPVYAYPNPATREALEQFQYLEPNAEDPTGVRISFANLPACRSRISIFTLAGDLLQTIEHDGSGGDGQAYWNLITHNGQEIVSGIYLFVVQPLEAGYEDAVGKFVVIR